MKVQATRAFLHEGRIVAPLDVLEVPNDFAAALIHWDKARKFTEPEPAQEAPAETPEPAPRRGKKEPK
jgi:hypothetical protein